MIETVTRGTAGLVLDGIAKAIDPTMAKAALKAASYAGAEIGRQVIKDFPRGVGALARSFLPATMIETAPGSVSAGALSRLVYAGIQDEGGTIRPKTAQMLAVPVSKKAKKLWPRDWPAKGLVCIKSKKGNLLLIDARMAKRKKIVVHYVLKDSVKITGSGYLDTASDAIRDKVQAVFAEAIGKAIETTAGVTR
jgi:hypothetical protein